MRSAPTSAPGGRRRPAAPAIALLCVAAALSACDDAADGVGADAAVDAPTFFELHDEVFSGFCVLADGCHSSSNRSGFLDLGSVEAAYADLVDAPAMGSNCRRAGWVRVVPGDPDASLLVHKLEGTADCGARMPSSESPLSDATIARVRAWIAAGARMR